MALAVNTMDSSGSIRFHIGVNEDGKDITTTRIFSGVKANTDDADLYEFLTALIQLQENPVISVVRTSKKEYVEE
ncbi:MAG: DUF1659 domain-containing protein [Clostridiales bacterium]|nr:DUF1659 domain-containing protein [Clostridiales bacterium]